MNNRTKTCSKCGIDKILDEFPNRKGSVDGKRGDCKICRKEIQKKFRENNPEKIRETGREYRKNNPEKERERHRKYRKNNPEKERERHRKYRENNPEMVREGHRRWWKKKYHKDDSYRIQELYRKFIWKSYKGKVKPESSITHLGCTYEFFQNWSLSDYPNGLDPNEKYHIDHTQPLTSFDFKTNPEDIYIANNWRNLRLIPAKENLSKGGRRDYEAEEKQKITAFYFEQLYENGITSLYL